MSNSRGHDLEHVTQASTTPPTPAQLQAAALQCAAHAHDTTDLHYLLALLGLDRPHAAR